jgi:integrase
MGNRRFEMHEIRHILYRMRQGEFDRDLARIRLIGRGKAADLRKIATLQGWLSPENPLPDDVVLAGALAHPRLKPGRPSSLHSHKERSFAVAVRKAGLAPFRFHDLRHTFASRLAMNGANDRTLQTLGGWKTPRMLLRYSHLGPSHLQEAVEELARPKLTISDSLPKIETGSFILEP